MATTDKPEDKTKAELEAELKDAGKPITGTKGELVERVEALDKEHRPDVYVATVRPK